MDFIDYSHFFNNTDLTSLISFKEKNYAIKKNRDDFVVSLKFDPKQIIFPNQTHSNNVKIIDYKNTYNKTDGLITTTQNFGVGILIADCAPIFLFGIKTSHCGVIHSGWRGAANKITTNALKKFIAAGNKPSEIKAVIGPSIDKCCFEIGEDIARNFSSKNLILKKGSKFYLNIKNEIYDELISASLSMKNIYRDSHCTFCHEDKFFSYRREGVYSWRMAAIMKVNSK